MKSLFVLFLTTAALAAEAPHPQKNPGSPLMLSGAWVPEDTHRIDFARLPRVPSEHAVVSDVHAQTQPDNPQVLDKKKGGVNQHNYLAFHDGQFWAMWSDGPGIEDRVGQRVKYATSADGLKWSAPQFLTPVPPGSGTDSPHYGTRTNKGFRYIARGFWKREGEMLALASLDEAAGFFGPSLELRAFRFNKGTKAWEDAGLVCKNAINNFPPLKLRTGSWMMSRRAWDYKTSGVHFLVGGVKGLDQWESFPVFGTASELKAEEPDWWILPDNSLAAVFRDNRRSGFLYRSFSTDDGRTWSPPVKTNFPDATSKISGLRLGDGRYVLVSNPDPKKRDPLTLSISDDGLVFTKMLYLVGGRHIDYPHVMEHDGCLYVAFAGGKQSVEVLKVKISDVDAVMMPQAPLVAEATASEDAAVTPPQTQICQAATLVAAEKFDRPASLAKEKQPGTEGWRAGIGTWSIKDGAAHAVQEGPGKNRPNGHEAVCEHLADLGDLVLSGEFRLGASPQVGFVARDTHAPNHHLGRVVITPTAIWIQKMSGIAKETRREELRKIEVSLDPAAWHRVTVEICGDRWLARIDGHVIEARHERFKDRKGRVGMVARGEGAQFRNLSLWSAAPRP